jgi:hypothetical protein
MKKDYANVNWKNATVAILISQKTNSAQGLLLWFEYEMFPIGSSTEYLVPSWWHFKKVLETVGGSPKIEVV